MEFIVVTMLCIIIVQSAFLVSMKNRLKRYETKTENWYDG